MSRRSKLRSEAEWRAFAEKEWSNGSRLYHWLASGGELQPVYSTAIMRAGEQIFADLNLSVSRYHAIDVTYSTASSVAFGTPMFVAMTMLGTAARNKRIRRDADALAQPQWRTCVTRIILTSQRVSYLGQQGWVDFDHVCVREYAVTLGQHVVAQYSDCPPLGLFGPNATWIGVAWAYLLFGREHFLRLPWLHPFTTSPVLLPAAPVEQLQPDNGTGKAFHRR